MPRTIARGNIEFSILNYGLGKKEVLADWVGINGIASTTTGSNSGSYYTTKQLAEQYLPAPASRTQAQINTLSALDTAYTTLRTFLNNAGLNDGNDEFESFNWDTYSAYLSTYWDAEKAVNDLVNKVLIGGIDSLDYLKTALGNDDAVVSGGLVLGTLLGVKSGNELVAAMNSSNTLTGFHSTDAPSFGGFEIAPGPLMWYNGEYVIKDNWNYSSYGTAYGWNVEGSTYFSFLEMGTLFDTEDFDASYGSIRYNKRPFAGDWRMPTKDEFETIVGLNGNRPGSNVNGIPNRHYAKITLSSDITFGGVSGPKGLLLFPDDCTITATASGIPLTGLDIYDSDFSSSPVTSSELSGLLTVGCAFLPVAGWYETASDEWAGMSATGNYMSATSKDETQYSEQCYTLHYEDGDLYVGYNGDDTDKTSYLPIRLVRISGNNGRLMIAAGISDVSTAYTTAKFRVYANGTTYTERCITGGWSIHDNIIEGGANDDYVCLSCVDNSGYGAALFWIGDKDPDASALSIWNSGKIYASGISNKSASKHFDLTSGYFYVNNGLSSVSIIPYGESDASPISTVEIRGTNSRRSGSSPVRWKSPALGCALYVHGGYTAIQHSVVTYSTMASYQADINYGGYVTLVASLHEIILIAILSTSVTTNILDFYIECSTSDIGHEYVIRNIDSGTYRTKIRVSCPSTVSMRFLFTGGSSSVSGNIRTSSEMIQARVMYTGSELLFYTI